MHLIVSFLKKSTVKLGIYMKSRKRLWNQTTLAWWGCLLCNVRDLRHRDIEINN